MITRIPLVCRFSCHSNVGQTTAGICPMLPIMLVILVLYLISQCVTGPEAWLLKCSCFWYHCWWLNCSIFCINGWFALIHKGCYNIFCKFNLRIKKKAEGKRGEQKYLSNFDCLMLWIFLTTKNKFDLYCCSILFLDLE